MTNKPIEILVTIDNELENAEDLKWHIYRFLNSLISKGVEYETISLRNTYTQSNE